MGFLINPYRFSAPSTLLTGLISYWKADSSSTFPDAYGSNDGTINGATYTSSGKINGAYSFDNVNDYITLTGFDTRTQKGSYSCWIKTTDSTTRGYMLTAVNNTTTTATYISYNYDNSTGTTAGKLGFYQYIAGTQERAFYTNIGADIYDGNWHHYVIEWDGSSSTGGKMFFDGVEKTITNTKSSTFSSGIVTDYKIGDTTSHTIGGTLDEPAIWNRLLTSDEVTELYNSGSGKQYPFT